MMEEIIYFIIAELLLFGSIAIFVRRYVNRMLNDTHNYLRFIKQDIDAVSYQIRKIDNSVTFDFNSTHRRIDAKVKEIEKNATNRSNRVQSTLCSEIEHIYEAMCNMQSENINAYNGAITKIKNETRKQIEACKNGIDLNIQKISELSRNNETNFDNLARLSTQTETNLIQHLEQNLKSVYSKFAESTKVIVESIKNIMVELERTNSSFEDHRNDFVTYKQKMESFATILNSLESVTKKISAVNDDIAQQEISLVSMVNKQREVAVLTDELNRTAKDVFGLMKLLLMSSVVHKSSSIIPLVDGSVAQAEIKNQERISAKVKENDTSISSATNQMLAQKQFDIELDVEIINLRRNQHVGILGNIPELGNWDQNRYVSLQKKSKCKYQLKLHITTSTPVVEFKYVIVDDQRKSLLWGDKGANRTINLALSKDSCIHRDDKVKL